MTPLQPRPGISDIVAYQPGKSAMHDNARAYYKLSANESALGPSPAAMAAYMAVERDLHVYPEGSGLALRQAIGTQYKVDPDLIVCGAGSDELIALLMRAYLGPGESIVQTQHGFSVYGICAQACGARAILAPEVNLTATIDTILEAVEPKTRCVFLANPNNPTGTAIDHTALVQLRQKLRQDILLVIDAAYAEYVQWPAYNSGIDLVNDVIASGNDNVVMTRTFSKIYGLGGLRLGWAYCPKTIAAVLHKIRGPFNISTAAIAAGVAAVCDTDFVHANRAHNERERERLTGHLARREYHVVPGLGNFLLVRMPGETPSDRQARARRLVAFMEERCIFIRALDVYNLPEYIRVTLGPVTALDAFLAAVDAFQQYDRINTHDKKG